MSNQSKPGLFGSSSAHKISARKGDPLDIRQFLELEETKEWIAAHPDAVVIDGDNVFVSQSLALRYLHLSGNKRAKKDFIRKTSRGDQ